MIEDDEHEILSFLLEDELYLESLYLNATVAFIETDFEEGNLLLALEERKTPCLETMTMEALLASQKNAAFCAEISLRVNGVEKLSFSKTENGLFSGQSTQNLILSSLIP